MIQSKSSLHKVTNQKSKRRKVWVEFTYLENKKKKKKEESQPKFKTEMCKNWDLLGRCNYGKKCQFAHGL